MSLELTCEQKSRLIAGVISAINQERTSNPLVKRPLLEISEGEIKQATIYVGYTEVQGVVDEVALSMVPGLVRR